MFICLLQRQPWHQVAWIEVGSKPWYQGPDVIGFESNHGMRLPVPLSLDPARNQSVDVIGFESSHCIRLSVSFGLNPAMEPGCWCPWVRTQSWYQAVCALKFKSSHGTRILVSLGSNSAKGSSCLMTMWAPVLPCSVGAGAPGVKSMLRISGTHMLWLKYCP